MSDFYLFYRVDNGRRYRGKPPGSYFVGPYTEVGAKLIQNQLSVFYDINAVLVPKTSRFDLIG